MPLYIMKSPQERAQQKLEEFRKAYLVREMYVYYLKHDEDILGEKSAQTPAEQEKKVKKALKQLEKYLEMVEEYQAKIEECHEKGDKKGEEKYRAERRKKSDKQLDKIYADYGLKRDKNEWRSIDKQIITLERGMAENISKARKLGLFSASGAEGGLDESKIDELLGELKTNSPEKLLQAVYGFIEKLPRGDEVKAMRFEGIDDELPEFSRKTR